MINKQTKNRQFQWRHSTIVEKKKRATFNVNSTSNVTTICIYFIYFFVIVRRLRRRSFFQVFFKNIEKFELFNKNLKHIKKAFCTKWPEQESRELEGHFPVKLTTSTYIYDGPSIRDDRARIVTMQVNVNELELNSRAHQKFIKLCEHRYDEKKRILKSMQLNVNLFHCRKLF